MTLILYTPIEVTKLLAQKAREKRLSQNLSQQGLSTRSGVSLSVLKKFEATGKISLESLLKIALILDSLDEFVKLFENKPIESYKSLDEIINEKKRRRGRKK